MISARRMKSSVLVSVCALSVFASQCNCDEYPWQYDNDVFGGPDFWGLVQKNWRMCANGKMQSPINIAPSTLLYDPNLRPLAVDKSTVSSDFVNTGQMPRVRIANSLRWPSANITLGPLAPYRYRMQRIDIHFDSKGKAGSEHAIDFKKFPMEIQIIAFNSDLYKNFTTALVSPHGIAALSILVQVEKKTNEELRKMTAAVKNITFKRRRVELQELKPWKMLPHKADYVTYEGSMTSPGCQETVTWIIINHPIYITDKDLQIWSTLQRSYKQEAEPLYMSPNFRPLRESNGRVIRTNIRHRFKDHDGECKKLLTDTWYRSNHNRTLAKNLNLKSEHRRRHSSRHQDENDFI